MTDAHCKGLCFQPEDRLLSIIRDNWFRDFCPIIFAPFFFLDFPFVLTYGINLSFSIGLKSHTRPIPRVWDFRALEAEETFNPCRNCAKRAGISTNSSVAIRTFECTSYRSPSCPWVASLPRNDRDCENWLILVRDFRWRTGFTIMIEVHQR